MCKSHVNSGHDAAEIMTEENSVFGATGCGSGDRCSVNMKMRAIQVLDQAQLCNVQSWLYRVQHSFVVFTAFPNPVYIL